MWVIDLPPMIGTPFLVSILANAYLAGDVNISDKGTNPGLEIKILK